MSEPGFKILQIDHIGIAVNNPESLSDFLGVLKIASIGSENIADQQVATTMFDVDSVHLELLQPTEEASTIAKFIAKRGEGFHHLALRVDDLQNAIAYLTNCGLRMIDQEPRRGAGGKLIAFLHPKSTGGILIELTQLDPNYLHHHAGETGVHQ